jgi:FkbM family methyltransferase
LKELLLHRIKLLINNCTAYFGYQIYKAPFSRRQIESGHFKWLQDLGIQTILDIGANEGQFINKISLILPEANIYSFEPLKKPFEQLQKLAFQNKNITAFNFALGDEEKESIIHHNEYSPSSSMLELTSLHKGAFPFTRNVLEENISVKVFDKISSGLNLQKNILLKIDVQGFEINVLRGAEGTLKDIDVIFIETSFYELYKHQPLFNDIYSFLFQRGFGYFGSFEQLYDERDGRILQADSIFIKI